MEEREAQASSFYKPSLGGGGGGGERGGFDQSVRELELELMSVDQCETIGDLDDSQLVGAPDTIAAGAGGVGKDDQVVAHVEVKLAEKSVEKRKRGRPPSRGQVKASAPVRRKKDEEDVCFICFDGGSLVLCDRRGCPKAYHPACIKRDESFFRSRAKWNCGWHICSTCQKASHYMCYTCTYSLCKGCTKDADYVCVRGSKGFCGTCMRTIMLIENLQGNKEAAQVDFDDKSSWEYLFKVYWVLLKGKLSLTIDELVKAKNPWKGPPVAVSNGNRLSSIELHGGNEDKSFVSGHSCADLEASNAKRRKITISPEVLTQENSLCAEKSGGDRITPMHGDTNWASKELLEFVAHMRNGDISVMSQFDVQGLLLEYIKRNKLRDPREKCQIVCDSRLLTMFGKARLGHFEMLRLLEYHFLIKEDVPVNNSITAGLVNSVDSQMESDQKCDSQMTMINDKRRKTRKRIDERVLPTNLDAYAAIDVHNINLIYLRRNLLEILLDDAEKFHKKVVGSIVRIRISSNDQKPEMHRLVRVVGTSKSTEPYNIGTKATDVMLEILNLDKKEVLSIDGISNQEFSQDECERLRQSIKCGSIKRLTVGEIQEKAMELQTVKVNDWLGAEILRLTHLRDRASEKGHRKELRECVEKLQLLNSTEERKRRLEEVPIVNSDPKMDPICDFDDNSGELDEKKQDVKVKPRNSGLNTKRREPISSGQGSNVLINGGSSALKHLITPLEQSRDNKETVGVNGWNTLKNEVDPSGSGMTDWSNQAVVGSDSFSDTLEIMTLALSAGTNQSVNDFEGERIWHYEDPTGKIQGPFSMLHLRTWSTRGLFPRDFRIWRVNEKQEDSILLTDALTRQYCKEQLLPCNSHLPQQEVKGAPLSDDRDNDMDGGQNKSMNATPVDGEKVEESRNLEQDNPSRPRDGYNEAVGSVRNPSRPHDGNNEAVAQVGNNEAIGSDGNPSKPHDSNNEALVSDELGSHLSSCTTLAVVKSSEGHSGIFSEGPESLKGNTIWPTQPQVSSSLPQPQVSSSLPTPVFPEKQSLLHQVSEDHVTERNSSHSNEIITPDRQTRNNQACENLSEGEGHSGQSSGQNWRPPVSSPSNGWDSTSGHNSVPKSLGTSERNQEGIPNLPNPTQKPSNGGLAGQATEKTQSPPRVPPVQDAGLSWSTASSLVGGGAQLHEVAGDWGGYSPNPAKPSVEEWDSSLVSASSLKPTEMVCDHAATPASISDQLTHSSSSHPQSNASSWHDIVPEPNEFSSLVDESVSDLLAEVEAMESLNRLASPTVISCGGELTEGSKNDCLSSVEEFSPVPEPGKGDALSSTADIHLPPQSNVTDEPLGGGNAAVIDCEKRSMGQPSVSTEVEGDAKHSDVSVNQWEATTEIQPSVPSTAGWDVGITDAPWNARSESTDNNWGAVPANADMGWDGGLDEGNAIMDWGTSQPTTQAHTNMHSGTPAGSTWGGQPRYGGEKFPSPRDRAFHGRDSGFSRNRHGWNRQPFFGGGHGVQFRPPPKGQRICKFYESGYCKKGASCSYWHP